eukprot:2588526-Rhodomonas_salina.1
MQGKDADARSAGLGDQGSVSTTGKDTVARSVGGVRGCKHNRRRAECSKECRGAGICERNRRRARCKECRGALICEHNLKRKRSKCAECWGSQARVRGYSCFAKSVEGHLSVSTTDKDHCARSLSAGDQGSVSITGRKQNARCAGDQQSVSTTGKDAVARSVGGREY